MFDVIIIGASVTGLRTAELISSKGYDVLVIEEHKEIGKPLKCAGLVSWRIFEIMPSLSKEIIVNTIEKAKFFSPKGDFFELKSKKPIYVIDRVKLDKILFKEALKNGTQIKTLTKFEGFKHLKNSIEIKTSKGNFESKILVGADGSNSKVAKVAGIKIPNNMLIGIQTTVSGNFDPSSVELWFGSFAPNFFGWVIPESEKKARIGLATKSNCKFYFNKFLKKRIGKIEKPNVFGVINFGLMNSIADRILLVGDAACQVKPFSGGGIIYGLISSEFCANACIKALEEDKFDAEFLNREYDEKWKKKLKRPIKKGLLYRKILNNFSDMQLNFIFSLLKILRLTKILECWDVDLLMD